MTSNQSQPSDPKLTKILFRYHSNVLEEIVVETMWASIVDEEQGFFKIDNIPFYGPPVSSGDIVFAEFDANEEMLTYRLTIEYSGNSTIQVVLTDKTIDIESIRDVFSELGCVSEKMNAGYFVMEVSAEIRYAPIREKLSELAHTKTIDFAEPCLAAEHRKEC